MSFKLEDIGKKIIIHDAEGANWIKKGKEYIIASIVTRNKIHLKDISYTWQSTKEGSWSFVEETKEDFNEGDKVILNKEVTSLKKGHPTVVKGFINNDKQKVVVEGLMPGGWINPRSLVRIIDTEKYRIKKAIELVSEIGPGFIHSTGLGDSDLHIFGRKLSEFKITQNGSEILIDIPHQIFLPSSIYTDKEYEPLEMFIADANIIKDMNSGSITEGIQQLANKNFREVRTGFDPDDDKSVIQFCKDYCRRGYITIAKISLNTDGFKIVKRQTNETIQTTALLPF